MDVSGSLVDRFGRLIDYLRISLTERCDLRCAYCRAAEGTCVSRADVLTADDILAIAEAAVRVGVKRIRLTGGEPLLRSDLADIVSHVSRLPGVEDLSLTTNGQALASQAERLAAAGLMRGNVSLDSLDPQVYSAITGGGDLAAVLRGLDAAFAVGLAPVKVNVVLDCPAALERAPLSAFIRLIARRPVHVRFIEAMPTCSHVTYLPAARLLDELSRRGSLVSVAGPAGGGPARYYRVDDAPGTIGVIAPITEPFCSQCNRLRVSARGELMPCLFSPTGLPLAEALGGSQPTDDIVALLREAAAVKPRRYGDIALPARIHAMHVVGG